MASNMEKAGYPRLFNGYFHRCSDRKFQLFSRLPLELRRDIWDTFLQEHRILHIGVRSSDRPDPAGSYTQKNHLGNIRSGKNYSLSIDKYHSDSPLLRVNSEARAAALAFYRVHLPCSQGLDAVTSRILYFNPDFDFLHVQILVTGEHEHTEVPLAPPDLLADVFYDCKAYDPKGHGIRNLMVGDGLPYGLRWLPSEPQALAPQALEAFRSTLTNLKTLYFYHRGKERMMVTELTDRIRFNRATPLESLVEGFTLIGPDPRPIRDDLGLFCVGWDPRASLWFWQDMERIFDIVRPEGKRLDSRFLITWPTWRSAPAITSCSKANEYLKTEQKRWDREFTDGVFREVNNPDAEGLERSKNAQHVFGFWLFDTHAFGEMPENAVAWELQNVPPPMPWHRWKFKMDIELDVTKYWPELGVFHLTSE